jgi:hypothetical protein
LTEVPLLRGDEAREDEARRCDEVEHELELDVELALLMAAERERVREEASSGE